MLTTVVIVMQLAVSLIMGVYFYKQLKRQEQGKTGVKYDSQAELDRLRRLRAVKLNLPMSERVRPTGLERIIGQEEAVEALKAILCGPHPQNVILYGPPGVGKTCAARLVLEEAKRGADTAFAPDAPFIEMDATCVRFDERAIADPLLGSVHDPIYQGAGPLGAAGVPQPKPGAVTKAHGGVLFLDEIGELHPLQMNKLLKVLEDRRVMPESAYYAKSDPNIPRHIHDMFQNGLPADFRLIGATTRSPEELPPALRSRCMEICFRPLTAQETTLIAQNCAKDAGFAFEEGCDALIGSYSPGGRDATNLTQVAAGLARTHHRRTILCADVEYVLRTGAYVKRVERKMPGGVHVGRVSALAVSGGGEGLVLPVEAVAFPVSKGRRGMWQATGIVDSERLNAGSRTLLRRSTAAGALENVRTVLRRLGLAPDAYDVHLDFPGGMPVDGPSAGVAMGAAIYSALTGTPLSGSVAVTGELSVLGAVLPVGGVPAKVRAALLGGAEMVLVPVENMQAQLLDEPRVRPIATFHEALDALLSTAAPNRPAPLPIASGDTVAAKKRP